MALPAPGENSTALVTGASSGIGTEIARGLASRGHGVTLVARREDRLRELATELADAHGVRTEIVACDLGGQSGRDHLAGEVEQLGLDVGVLVNNAGFGDLGDFVSLDRERQVGMVALNCEAVVDLTGRFLPAMVERGEGIVINIASTAAFQPMPKNATYAASKSFVLSFSEALHQELKGTGVTTTAVCPGPIRTEFMDAAGMEGTEDSTPDLIWMSAEDLASEALEAAEKGKRAVVPGKLNFAGSLLGRFSPRRVALPLAERAWKQVE
jgi:uncharacterized protein